jgi:hypothetical protein
MEEVTGIRLQDRGIFFDLHQPSEGYIWLQGFEIMNVGLRSWPPPKLAEGGSFLKAFCFVPKNRKG